MIIFKASPTGWLSLERIIVTEDGSHSMYSARFHQQYHSLQGAVAESVHIYINLGLRPILETATDPVRIFEMGLGTGLNAFLAWKLADELRKPVTYTAVEAYPISLDEAITLNYDTFTGESGLADVHRAPWNEDYSLSPFFTFRKEEVSLQAFETSRTFDVIFFDAFDPQAQPELWTEEIFLKIAAFTQPGGVLVTYSSKGIVKRALAAAGFTVERHKGPGRKAHVLRAIKN